MGHYLTITQAFRFSVYYDIDKWNDMVHYHGRSLLVRWEEFLSNSSHKIIVLHTLLRAARKLVVIINTLQ